MALLACPNREHSLGAAPSTASPSSMSTERAHGRELPENWLTACATRVMASATTSTRPSRRTVPGTEPQQPTRLRRGRIAAQDTPRANRSRSRPAASEAPDEDVEGYFPKSGNGSADDVTARKCDTDRDRAQRQLPSAGANPWTAREPPHHQSTGDQRDRSDHQGGDQRR